MDIELDEFIDKNAFVRGLLDIAGNNKELLKISENVFVKDKTLPGESPVKKMMVG